MLENFLLVFRGWHYGSIRNKLKEAAEGIGLPTFVVADAGRTQVTPFFIQLRNQMSFQI